MLRAAQGDLKEDICFWDLILILYYILCWSFWFYSQNKKKPSICYVQHIYIYWHVHLVHTNIHIYPLLWLLTVSTHAQPPSPFPKCPSSALIFCWNNETPWHWKVRFLLPQSCLRTVHCCCHCHASHSMTSSIWSIAGDLRLEKYVARVNH